MHISMHANSSMESTRMIDSINDNFNDEGVHNWLTCVCEKLHFFYISPLSHLHIQINTWKLIEMIFFEIFPFHANDWKNSISPLSDI